MTEVPVSPQEKPPRWRRLFTPRALGITSLVLAGAAAVSLVAATQTAVVATSSPPAPESAPIAPDSSDEGSPEKAAEVVPPAVIAAAYDQLSGQEVEYVRYLGAQNPEFLAGLDVFGAPGMQFLSTDVADPLAYGDGQRRLLSLYYDYGTDELVSFVVNVSQGGVENVQRATGSQPAPTEAETILAWELLLESDRSAPLFEEFSSVSGGGTLAVGSPEIELTAHSFVTDVASFGAESCGVERCVQLLAQVNGGPFLTTTPFVVNLSTKTVLSVL